MRRECPTPYIDRGSPVKIHIWGGVYRFIGGGGAPDIDKIGGPFGSFGSSIYLSIESMTRISGAIVSLR